MIIFCPCFDSQGQICSTNYFVENLSYIESRGASLTQDDICHIRGRTYESASNCVCVLWGTCDGAVGVDYERKVGIWLC